MKRYRSIGLRSIYAELWEHAHVIPPAQSEVLRQKGWVRRRWQLLTVHGWVNIRPPVYIVQSVENGDWWPVAVEIFASTYEPYPWKESRSFTTSRKEGEDG